MSSAFHRWCVKRPLLESHEQVRHPLLHSRRCRPSRREAPLSTVSERLDPHQDVLVARVSVLQHPQASDSSELAAQPREALRFEPQVSVNTARA